MDCDRCGDLDAVIDSSSFCPSCQDRTMICAECFAWHVRENIEDLEYERTYRR